MEYKTALDHLKLAEDGYGRAIWVEETMHDGRPMIFYRYVNGRLKRYQRTVWGWSVSLADIARFGDQIERTTPSAAAASTPPS